MRFRPNPFAVAVFALSSVPALAQQHEPATPTEIPAEIMVATAGEAVVLEPVKVVDRAPGDDFAAPVATVGKLPLAVRDIPQVVTVVTRAVLDAQNATSLTEALRNVPGITLQAGEGGAIGDNVNLRGFTARTDIYLDGSRDRGQYKRDTFALDSVEVLKGPSSLFFGRGSTGGVINQVSKTPLKTDLNQVGFAYGTDDYTRTTADFNRVLSDTAAVRVALFAQDVKSTRDVVQQQDWGIAPSLRVALNKDTDLTLIGLYQQNRDVPDYGLPFVDGAPAKVSHERFYGNTDDQFDQDTAVGKIKLEHRFNDWLTLQNQTQLTENTTRANPTPYRVCTAAFNNAGSAPTGPCPVAAPGAPYDQITVQSDRRDRELKDTSAFTQFDAIAKLQTGRIGHVLIAGIELGRDSTHNQAYLASRRQLDNLGQFEPNATPADITRTRAATFTEGSARTLGVYLNDTVSLAPAWKLVAGIRRDRFDADVKTINNSNGAIANQANGQPNAFERTDYGTSLRGGVIWQPTATLSSYASYGTSFNPTAEAVTISAAQAAVAPEKTQSYELGAKWEVFNGNLSLSGAVFRIEKTDARTTDQLGVVTVDGKTQVQGFEVGAVGRVSRNWQVIAGYSHLDSELKQTRDGSGTGANRVSFRGNDLPNTPPHSASLFTTYRILRDYEVGGGFNYIDKRYVTTSNLTQVDSYVRADLLAAYHQPRYDIQLNVQNVFDKDYFDSIVASENGRAVPGRGRTVILSGLFRWGKS